MRLTKEIYQSIEDQALGKVVRGLTIHLTPTEKGAVMLGIAAGVNATVDKLVELGVDVDVKEDHA